MSKLFKLKKWLNVSDAAKRLAITFGEDVTEADVFRLALDGHLRLSVNLINGATCIPGKIVPIGDATFDEVPSRDGKRTIRLYGGPVLSDAHGVETDVLKLEDRIVTLEGIFDLPMIGGETLDIEHKFQMLTSGPAVTRESFDGAFVEGEGGYIFQLQSDYDDNIHVKGSRASLQGIEEHIAVKKLKPDEADKLLSQHKENSKQFIQERKLLKAVDRYHPAGGLPDDAVIVVRSEMLAEFEQLQNGPLNAESRPLLTKERNTLLTIIAVLCKEAKLDPTKTAKTAGFIYCAAASMGVLIGETTIENHLKKIPDALGTRTR